ncbi:MAG TPA: transcriptional regulator NrdR [Candidatus Nanoarchaeia archaeon]|nr:transcriptional regulator NrdR [Candidatus Nanoarchaeia archaeon]
MLCPFCLHKETKVTNKRDAENLTRRRRECLKCRKRFTTYEKVESPEFFVVKKDGRREQYNKDKLLLGIVKACEKRAVSHDKIEKAVNEIEEKLRKKGREVKSMMIGELVMKALKKLDKIAYIRFASVYRDFKDVDDFRNITKEIKK